MTRTAMPIQRSSRWSLGCALYAVTAEPGSRPEQLGGANRGSASG